MRSHFQRLDRSQYTLKRNQPNRSVGSSPLPLPSHSASIVAWASVYRKNRYIDRLLHFFFNPLPGGIR